ncbi:MAG: MATE family efflux transporter, partial [Clostridiales bacterium]|nr:MATE family efflux transporter [Candidatus Blautia equi]
FIVGATNCAVQAVCNATLSTFGGDLYIGIMTIINSVREIIGLPIHGITSGSQPVLSFNYGAKNYGRVKTGIRVSSLMALGYTAVFWVTTLVLPHVYLRIFSNDPGVIQNGVGPLRIYFLGFIFMALQFAGQSTFTSLGRARQAIFFSIFRKIIIVVPFTILLSRIPALGVMGVFWAEPLSNLIGGCASFFCMYFTVYRKL